MAHVVSPLAPTAYPDMPEIPGVALAAAATGIRYKGRVDVLLATLAEGTTVAEVRSIFDRAAQIDDIRTIAGKDLEIGKEGDRVVVSFAYDREIHLTGPAYLLMRYEGRSR